MKRLNGTYIISIFTCNTYRSRPQKTGSTSEKLFQNKQKVDVTDRSNQPVCHQLVRTLETVRFIKKAITYLKIHYITSIYNLIYNELILNFSFQRIPAHHP